MEDLLNDFDQPKDHASINNMYKPEASGFE